MIITQRLNHIDGNIDLADDPKIPKCLKMYALQFT